MLVTVKCKLLPNLFPRGVTSAKHEEYAYVFFFGGVADMHVMDGLLVGFRTLRLQADSIFRYIL